MITDFRLTARGGKLPILWLDFDLGRALQDLESLKLFESGCEQLESMLRAAIIPRQACHQPEPGGLSRLWPKSDGYLAAFPFTDTLGIDLFMIAKFNVHNASFVGGHWLKSNRPTTLDSLLGDAPGKASKLLFAPFSVSLYINYHGNRTA
jgi:hypothetical protein